ncbi:hypothetical protein ASD52_04720 [Ensifer sp. Root142]|uniref:hypothetical protein n=1 Tax=Ensifer sp. Root142 TaxID=1736461 RepID=UPI00070CF0F9|nr:hypothetical protein [Ensifer sp. Root142]KQY79118.1 hypothetical protein ASD52_04720 [Ensifer sp. Root142]
MNFAVYQDTGSEIHGYIVPDGFSTKARVAVRINGNAAIEIDCWIYVDGAFRQGLHETGNVAFILDEGNVPGISSSDEIELLDPASLLVFYRRASPGQYIPKKVFRLETAYMPHSEIDLSLKPFFQFFEYRAEHWGHETVRQMLEIIHQPSVYVSGRILLKNYMTYLEYNTEITMVALRDPFYELAMRLIIFSRYNKHKFGFVAPRDITLFKPIMDHFDGLNMQDEAAVRRAIRHASKDTISLLSSPFTQQLVAGSPNEPAPLDAVTRALDALSRFTLFDAGSDDTSYAKSIAELLGLPSEAVRMKAQLEAVHRVADVLREIATAEHLLEADLILYHFIQKAETRVGRQS